LTIRLIQRLRNNTIKTETRLYVRIALQESDLHLLEAIQACFGGSISKRFHPKSDSVSYSYSSVSFSNCYNMIKYFDRYNLSSNKYLEYLFFRKAYLMVLREEHLTVEGISILKRLQRTMSRFKHTKK